MRNVRKQAELGRTSISSRRELTLGEMQQFMDLYKEEFESTGSTGDAFIKAIASAYYMGYAIGNKASRA